MMASSARQKQTLARDIGCMDLLQSHEIHFAPGLACVTTTYLQDLGHNPHAELVGDEDDVADPRRLRLTPNLALALHLQTISRTRCMTCKCSMLCGQGSAALRCWHRAVKHPLHSQ